MSSPRRQLCAALPYRCRAASPAPRSCLSRDVLLDHPEGGPQKDKAPHGLAAREAFEEAGRRWAAGTRSVGSFPYQKRLKNGVVTVCEVHVFPLRVRRQSKQWPEKEQREVKWLSVKDAPKR